MSDLPKPKAGVKRLTPIFFLIDASGSMEGDKMEAVNNAMREAIPAIQEFAAGLSDAIVRFNILVFNDGVRWTSDGMTNVEDMIWVDLKADGGTSLGAAYEELSRKLALEKDGGFLQNHDNNRPILILLSDGMPTDDAEVGFKFLNANRIFAQTSIRIAIQLEGEVDRSQLEAFAKGSENVISVETSKLKNRLQAIAIQSATQGSRGGDAKDIIKDNPAPKPQPEPAPAPDPTPDPFDNDPFDKLFD